MKVPIISAKNSLSIIFFAIEEEDMIVCLLSHVV
jgi:hypothetical protein